MTGKKTNKYNESVNVTNDFHEILKLYIVKQ